jgi:RND family efflux transporter MFP subunit
MSPLRQIAVSVAVLAVVAGGWMAFDRGLFSATPDAESARPPRPADSGRTPGDLGPTADGRGAGGQAGGIPAPVVTAAVETDASGLEVRAVGTVAAVRAVTLFPEATGVVVEVAFEPGSQVTEGQPLIRLDDAEQQVAVDRARVALDAARVTLDRSEQLSESNNITTAALNDTRTAVQGAEIDLRGAELELARRTLVAPFAGTIGLTDVTIGDLVNSSKAIATLDDMSTVTVAFEVPERASGRVVIGQLLTATTAAVAGQTFAGEVSAVDSRVDPVARTLKVEASLPNEANVLKPGMALNIVIAFPGIEHPAVPSLAVQWDRNGPYVWKVVDDSVSRVGVDIVGRRSGIVHVAGADLAAGDEVVVEGLQRLREGARVQQIGGPPGVADPAQAAPPRPGEAEANATAPRLPSG